MTVRAIQVTWKENDEEAMNELIMKYHCSSHLCFNKTEWCYVHQEQHYALIQIHFKM